MPDRKITIGLTGGIGTGKTTVALILEELGARVIHADSVGHEVYRPHTAGWKQVTDAFGAHVLADDGSIDRKKLGAIVFADQNALKRLNDIVHPLIFEEIRRRIGTIRATGFADPIVLEAAILVEANWLPLVDQVWLLVAPKTAVIDRVHAERKLSAKQIESRMDAQLDDDQRRRHADVVIENGGDLNELRGRVRAAWNNLG